MTPLANSRINLRNAHVLVVEDNPHALEILLQVLVGFGISGTQSFGCPEEGLAAATRERFDLLLVDAEMAGIDGFQFTRRVRENANGCNFTTPVIVVTGCPTRDKVVAARDAGVNFVISKPIVPKVLLGRIAWVAQDKREFVVADGYSGPDRRFHTVPLPPGVEERREHAKRIQESPQRDLSQDEIDSLF